MDDEVRNVLLRDAVRMAADDVAVIPLYNLVNVWATRRGIAITPRLDERTLAMDVRPG